MNFIEELKRRKVIKVGITYAVVAFIFMQLVEIIFPIFNIPLWVSRLAIILIVMGFPIVFILAWIFDVTPDGIVRTDSSSKSINSFLMSSLQLMLLLALVFGFTNPKKKDILNQVKKRLILLPHDEISLNKFIEKSISIRSYLFFSIGSVSLKDYNYNVTHGFLGLVYTSHLLPDIYNKMVNDFYVPKDKEELDNKILDDFNIDKDNDFDKKITEIININKKEGKIAEDSVSKTLIKNNLDSKISVNPTNKIDIKSIRQYDFSLGVEIIANKKLTIYLARTSFGPASVYEYPEKKSQVVSIFYSGESIYVFPIFREGFLVIGKSNNRPLGYMEVSNIQFSTTDRLGKIKSVSKEYFLETSKFVTR